MCRTRVLLTEITRKKNISSMIKTCAVFTYNIMMDLNTAKKTEDNGLAISEMKTKTII